MSPGFTAWEPVVKGASARRMTPAALDAGSVALGTYSVSTAYAIGGVPATQASTFQVVAGGDSGGEIISLFEYDRPEGRYVLAQLGSGRLVQGRDPYL